MTVVKYCQTKMDATLLGDHLHRERGEEDEVHLSFAAAAPKGLAEAALDGRGERLHAEALRRKGVKQMRIETVRSKVW